MGLATPPAGPVTGSGCDPGRVAAAMAARASPSRIEIIRQLANDELVVTDIAERLGLSVANASHHLGRLRRAELVISRRDGTRITDRLAGPHGQGLCAVACGTADAPAAAAARLG